MENLLGRAYYISDNSYAVCLTDKDHSALLAPCRANNETRTSLTVISQPILMKVKSSTGIVERTMILVKDEEDYVYCVLFNQKDLK
jgi:hypothetical protein